MYKLFDIKPTNSAGDSNFHVIASNDDRVKIASAESWAPKIAAKIKEIKPVDGKIFVVIVALGAGEYYGCNINGDYFPEDVLKETHNTFVTEGSPFMHHSNTKNSKVYGKILVSDYNDHMHRVEIITEYDTTKLPKKYVDKINNGDIVHTSMGCRVPYDICSICNNIAKSPKEYCSCLRNSPGIGKILPNGKKAFAINTKPEFFDDSIVVIPADRTARVMMKIASEEDDVVGSAANAIDEIGEENNDTVSDSDNGCDITSIISPAIDSVVRLLGNTLPQSLLDTVGSLGSPYGLAKSLLSDKIMLKPQETQRIILVSMGKPRLADVLDNKKLLLSNKPSSKIMAKILNSVLDRNSEAKLNNLLSGRVMTEPIKRRLAVRIIISPETEEFAKTATLINYTPESEAYRVISGEDETSFPEFKNVAATAGESFMDVLALGLVLGTINPALGAAVMSNIPLGMAGANAIETGRNMLKNEVSYTPETMTFVAGRDLPGLEKAFSNATTKVGNVTLIPKVVKQSISLLGGVEKLAAARKVAIDYIRGLENIHAEKFASIYARNKNNILYTLENLLFT